MNEWIGRHTAALIAKHPLLFALSKAKWTHLRSTTMWVLYNVLGSFLPIWGTYFVLRLYKLPFDLHDFVKHGEFALIAAAFLAPALQQVVKNIRDDRYVLGTGAALIAVTGLVVAAIVYSSVFVGSSDPFHAKGIDASKLLDQAFLFKLSNWLLALSLLYAVAITLVESVVFEADDINDGSQRRLNEQFSHTSPQIAPGLIDRSAQFPDLQGETQEELARDFEKKGKDAQQ